MTKVALGFASVGNTYVVRFDDAKVFTLEAPTKGTLKKKIPLEQVPDQVREPVVDVLDERIRFIDEELQAGDDIWCEMGGPAGPLLYRAFVKGVRVFRVPVVDIPGLEDSVEEDDNTDEAASGESFDSNRDKERRDRTLAVMELAKASPEKFYAMRVADAEIAAVSVMTRNFSNFQINRIRLQTQLLQINRDLAFYPDQSSKSLVRMRRAFGDEDLLQEIVSMEGRMERFLGSSLENIDLYKLVFEPINGCGVITSARIIDVIQDIRRFPSAGQFRRYTGWFPVGPSGQIARRTKGQSLRYNPKLKQAAHLMGMQIAQYGRGDDLRGMFETVYGLEDEKEGITSGHAYKRAIRKVIGEFLLLIFREWWRYEVTAGTMDTIKVPLGEIPEKIVDTLSFWYPDLKNQLEEMAA